MIKWPLFIGKGDMGEKCTSSSTKSLGCLSMEFLFPQPQLETFIEEEKVLSEGGEAAPNDLSLSLYPWHSQHRKYKGSSIGLGERILPEGNSAMRLLSSWEPIRPGEWKRQKVPMCHQIPHPQYNEETDDNDIMLLQLAKRVKLNRGVKTIALPQASERVKPGTVYSLAGWGRTRSKSESTLAMLQEVDVVVMKDAACPKKRNGTYHGDSGGPLVCGKQPRASSLGEPPGVYTSVSTFIPWIQETMKRLQP
ncbi:Granzyme F [Chelonia mydas]|uniref:Granzyme F n=1 Tax=Chelonia mydas TaxID=8469 RepID=M7ATX8_CHEMY|nr:Granzyme F [Chelonia mydas]